MIKHARQVIDSTRGRSQVTANALRRHRRNFALAVGALVIAAAGCSGSHAAQHGDQGDAGNQFGNADSKADSGLGALFSDAATRIPLSDCGASRFGASQTQVQLLLVIDKSGSMKDTPDGFDSDKWSAMKASLATALGAVQGQISIGLELYPLGEHCEMPAGSDIDVDLQPGDRALPLVMEALRATPSGGTPTSGALARALAYFTHGQGAKLAGEKYVLLATDGGPNCNSSLSCEADACTVNLDGQCPPSVMNCCDPTQAGAGAGVGCLDDQDTEGQIKALADAGIDTFVVGIPGSESYATSLNRFALAGGRARANAMPSYYAVDAAGTSAAGLTSVLQSITSSLVKSCRLQLDSVPAALDQINVQVDGVIVPQHGPDGWTIDDSTKPPTIVLEGKTCEHIERDGAKNVTILYGCPTQVD